MGPAQHCLRCWYKQNSARTPELLSKSAFHLTLRTTLLCLGALLALHNSSMPMVQKCYHIVLCSTSCLPPQNTEVHTGSYQASLELESCAHLFA